MQKGTITQYPNNGIYKYRESPKVITKYRLNNKSNNLQTQIKQYYITLSI